ncbi:glycosyltransferase family 4 protein [Alicyclobacillus ferrooxydans]|uniref:glycosyltransferase family 4 protein n=1 Tax=Alicyclobacillus ferrooxydans TaxID=471514 RepID=UPI0006D541D0|nr:glycosyltransferase family 4 protein [Alicyclobacillus ferrooxydans]
MSMRKTIVLVANDVGGVGGMEKHLEEMIHRMKRDYEVVVVASTLRLKDKEGVRFVRVPAPHRPFPLMTLVFSIYASIRVWLLGKNVIVHTTGAILLTKADVSTVHFCHAGWQQAVGDSHSFPSRLHRINHLIGMKIKLWMEKLNYRPEQTKYLIPVSQRVGQELADFYPYPDGKVKVVPNGVDVDRFYPATQMEKRKLRLQHGMPGSGMYLIFVGGDWERKGLRFMLEAFNDLAPSHPTLHALIVGSGDVDGFSQSVREIYRNRVHFVGRQSNPEIWYRMSDIFVFPSNYEACSLAVLEAGASGLAMVVANVGGAEDVIEHGITGYFVERDKDNITRTLQRILGSPDEVKRLGKAIRTRIEAYTWDKTYRSFAALYKEITDSETRNLSDNPLLSRG